MDVQKNNIERRKCKTDPENYRMIGITIRNKIKGTGQLQVALRNQWAHRQLKNQTTGKSHRPKKGDLVDTNHPYSTHGKTF